MELLVRVIDKYTGPDKKMKALTTGRGDVIVVKEDDWAWSQIERTSPQWIIIKIPGNAQQLKSKCLALRAQEERTPGKIRNILSFGLNLEQLAAGGHGIPSHAGAISAYMGWILGERSARNVESIEISEAELDSVKTRKPEIEDPAVIG